MCSVVVYCVVLAHWILIVQSTSIYTLANWTAVPHNLSAIDNSRSCAYNNVTGDIWMFGGHNSRTSMYKYTVESETWTDLSASSSVSLYSYGQFNSYHHGTLYYISGSVLASYNINTETLNSPLSQNSFMDVYGARACLTVSEDGNHLFILGGLKLNGAKTNTTNVYDINADLVRDAPSLTSTRSSAACTVLNDYLYIFGGDQNTYLVPTGERISISDVANLNDESWELLPLTLDPKRHLFEAITFGESIYLIGGQSDNEALLSTVQRIDPDNLSTLHDEPSLPEEGGKICSVVANNRIYFMPSSSTTMYWTSLATEEPSANPTEAPTSDPTADPTNAGIDYLTTYTTDQATSTDDTRDDSGQQKSSESSDNGDFMTILVIATSCVLCLLLAVAVVLKGLQKRAHGKLVQAQAEEDVEAGEGKAEIDVTDCVEAITYHDCIPGMTETAVEHEVAQNDGEDSETNSDAVEGLSGRAEPAMPETKGASTTGQVNGGTTMLNY